MSANDESPDSEVQVPGAMPGDVTRLLRAARGGDEGARDRVYDLVYGQLRDVAATSMRRESRGHTLQPTALVHEAWIKLVDASDPGWEGRRHFLAVAAKAMRNVLVDHARARGAAKRGGGRQRLPLDDALALYEDRVPDVLALDDALQQLAGVDEQLGRLVELRFFGGLSHEEAGQVLGISTRSAERGWSTARAWLRSHLRAS